MINRALATLTYILCFIFITACSAANDSSSVENQRENTGNKAQTTELQQDEKDAKRIQNNVEKQIITDLGIYIGQADENTIEIETNEGPKAFRVTEQTEDEIQELEPNDKVRFEYYINKEQQNTLKKIEKVKSKQNAPEVGIYNGQQDSNSIEIETNKGPASFQLSDNAKRQIGSLEIGKKVSYTYRVEGSQLIIETIEQIK